MKVIQRLFLFICTDYNMVYSVVTTAEKTNTPALVMLLPEHYEKNNTMNVHGFAEMVKELAESVKVLLVSSGPQL